MSRQGITKEDLRDIQAFVRTMKDPTIENPDKIALALIAYKGLWEDKVILQQANEVYAGRYGYIYSKGLSGTLRELNAAFKVKFYHEAVSGTELGHWDDELNRWIDAHSLTEMLTMVNELLYTEALKVIHCKISNYHSCRKVQTLLDHH